MSQLEVRGWSEVWPQAWPRAKRVAMEAQVQVEMFGKRWEEVWTQVEAKAWAKAEVAEAKAKAAEAKAREAQAKAKDVREARKIKAAKVEAEATADAAKACEAKAWEKVLERESKVVEAILRVQAAVAQAQALTLAGVWVWARARRDESEVLSYPRADSSTIWDILSALNHYGVTRNLWHHSREARDEYSCVIEFIAPITRLPIELLQQIFLIIIDETNRPPSGLMLGCKHWYAIITSIWAALNLGTRTSIDAVARKLARNQWLLDIVVDTDSDRGDFAPSDGAFAAMFATIEACARWRSFIVESFPPQADLTEGIVNLGLQRRPNNTMDRFTTFKIKSACEASHFLNGLLCILGTTARALITVEINSANVISFLYPAYTSMFHSIKVLSLDTPGIPSPVDLLPHLHHLETFTASYISFPIYHDGVDLPFIQTLRHLYLRAASIQWMSGRTFHVMEDCTLIFPLHHHVLYTFRTTLPNCTHLTFQGYPLDILGGVLAHKLAHLSVASSGSFNRRGSRQLLWLSHHILGQTRLTPHILHISVQATNQVWVNALGFMSSLEVLVISNARPSSLGVKVLQSLIVQPNYPSKLGANSTPGESGAPLCPLLRRFGLKYDRWLRPSEQFDLSLASLSIIESRQHSNCPLESFSLWIAGCREGLLELIHQSNGGYKEFWPLHRLEVLK